MNLQKKFEQYKAGELSAYNLLREARMAYPQLITQHNNIDDAVQILKTNGLVVEEYEVPTAPTSLDALETGIRCELEDMGCDIFSCTQEQYIKAREAAIKCLEKDPLCYVNRKAGVKGNEDHGDQMKPATSQNMVDDQNKIQKLQEAILTVALKRMLTEEVNESMVVDLPMTVAGYSKGETYHTDEHGTVRIIDQLKGDDIPAAYGRFRVEKV